MQNHSFLTTRVVHIAVDTQFNSYKGFHFSNQKSSRVSELKQSSPAPHTDHSGLTHSTPQVSVFFLI